MRKIAFYGFAVFAVFAFASCLKKDSGCPYTELNVKAPDSEVQKVQQYLESKGITALKDSSGVYYIVEAAGAGKVAEVCSVITVNYTGTLTNDQVFDKTNGTPAKFTLGGLIPGWQKGLKHIQTGGKIKLFIPPSLGYGDKDAKDANGNVIIPANSVIIFSLELVGVQ
ncbi:FKBP-type peptidyl-prolyl cis-trans isomerase [Agriterribacter sp.]|uniref:FKBP-type peptidyl-prolyl cis-trans isomerase n=1 Tax=Agriterribacter sp. TaxID=2821509 RepID=UPI002C748555|nr:FKBP-type peptidyl-prolyl cis-trans isomerase [Agriterribacter sp.]HTN05908.1 FKBP-type peptidyl-prolyl cis-trans isomerase [Agriterribacter sp.]